MVKVATNGKTVDVAYGENTKTVGDVATVAGFKPNNKATVQVNGKEASWETSVADNDLVTVTPKVGNG